ncbi:hypothetical protein MTO96_020282 [Rhipicephalus appendiculatus]
MIAPGSSGPNMTSPSTTQVTTPGSSVPDMTSPSTTQVTVLNPRMMEWSEPFRGPIKVRHTLSMVPTFGPLRKSATCRDARIEEQRAVMCAIVCACMPNSRALQSTDETDEMVTK